MKIKHISHACFKIELAGKIIYFDPYQIPSGAEKADIVCISHDHYDHYDEKAVGIIRKKETLFFCPATCKSIIKKLGAHGLKPGDTTEVDGIKITAVRAYNPAKRFHPKGNDWLGYIVEGEGIKIYHAGDTDVIPEMEKLGQIDYALLPVGDTYTMGFEDAVEAANIIKPKNVVPMHSWDKNLDEFASLMSKKAEGINVIILRDGEEYTA